VSSSNPIRTTQADTSPGMIDLALGHPSPSLLPLEAIRRAAEQRLGTDFTPYLQYGYEQGDGYFRSTLAEFLTRHYDLPVSADQLFISGGVSQALDLLCTLYSQPGDTVFVEEPTYFLALRIFTVPTHQNPSGATLPSERRRRLVSLSRDRGFLIVADEVYHLLTYEGQPPPPMAGFLSEGRARSCLSALSPRYWPPACGWAGYRHPHGCCAPCWSAGCWTAAAV